MTIHVIPTFGQIPCRSRASQRQFDHLIIGVLGWSLDWNGQTPFNSFPKVETKLLHRLTLSGAAGDGGNFGPKATFFRFVYDGLDCHEKEWWRRRELNPRPRKSTAKRLRAFPIRYFSTAPSEPARGKRLSLIGLGFQLQTE